MRKTDSPIKPSKLYTCPVCEANWYGRNLARDGQIPTHLDRYRVHSCAGAGQRPEGLEEPRV